jgi:hypothetical protein
MLRNAKRKWLVLSGLAFVLLAILAVVFVRLYFTKSELRQLEEHLDATDPGWRSVDLIAPINARVPPPERNSTELALRAATLLPIEWKTWNDSPDGKTSLHPTINHLPEPDRLAKARRVCTASRAALELAHTIDGTMDGGSLLGPAHRPSGAMQSGIDLAALLSALELDVAVAAFDRDPERAIRDVITITRILRGLTQEPTLVVSHVLAAKSYKLFCSIPLLLAHTEPNDAQLARLIDAWNRVPIEASWLRAMLRMERAANHELLNVIKATRTGPFARLQVMEYTRIQVEQLRFSNRFLELVARPTHEWDSQLRMLPTPTTSKGTIFPTLSLGDGVSQHRAYDDAIREFLKWCAYHRLVSLLLAAERFRLKTQHWPTTLADLAPHVPPHTFVDPITNQPFRLRTMPDGIILETSQTSEQSFGREIGLRLWSPASRRVAN